MPRGDTSKERTPSSSKPVSSSSSSTKASTESELEGYLKSHGGCLAAPLLSLVSSLQVTATELGLALGIAYLLLHLALPVFILPHYSALVTLIIPIQSTLRSVALEGNGEDGPQWCVFWTVYSALQMGRGMMGIFLARGMAEYEFIRTVILIAVGGPWFGKAGLVSPRSWVSGRVLV